MRIKNQQQRQPTAGSNWKVWSHHSVYSVEIYPQTEICLTTSFFHSFKYKIHIWILVERYPLLCYLVAKKTEIQNKLAFLRKCHSVFGRQLCSNEGEKFYCYLEAKIEWRFNGGEWIKFIDSCGPRTKSKWKALHKHSVNLILFFLCSLFFFGKVNNSK